MSSHDVWDLYLLFQHVGRVGVPVLRVGSSRRARGRAGLCVSSCSVNAGSVLQNNWRIALETKETIVSRVSLLFCFFYWILNINPAGVNFNSMLELVPTCRDHMGFPLRSWQEVAQDHWSQLQMHQLHHQKCCNKNYWIIQQPKQGDFKQISNIF